MKMNSSVQTKKKIIPKIFLHNFHQNLNPINNYYFNTLKNRELIFQYNKNLKNRNNIIKNKSNSVYLNISNIKMKLNNKSKEKKKDDKLPKISPYTFKYFCCESNKNSLHNSLLSSRVNAIEKIKTNLQSNFMRIKKDSNIYTSNASYIKNKKLVIIDKNSYDNNKYIPDRLGLFDMLDLKHPKKEKGKGLFGKIYYNHNKYLMQK